MTDAETIHRLRALLGSAEADLTAMNEQKSDMRVKIKRQRLENGRLNQSLSETLKHNLELNAQIKWMKGQ
jgi:uncharacterized protein YggU (UPF0235/DUF167 family)